MPLKTVAVIGATGLVGARLVERLRQNRNIEVRPVIHSSGNAWRLARLGIPLQQVNLLDASSTQGALAGCSHVVNCSRGSQNVMVRGLRNLLNASHRARVAGFVHLSSVMVYGDPPAPEAATEGAAIPRHLPGSYGDIKSVQDRMVQRAARAGLPALILCPPNISGPYSYFLLNLLAAISSGRFALLNDGQAPCVLVDADNLCDAIELALDNVSPDAPRLFVTDDEQTTWRQVTDELSPLLGSKPAIDSLSREDLELACRRMAPPKASALRTLKHLISSTVREALRQDPLLAKLDNAVRNAVAAMGEPIESRLRLAIEGPTRVRPVSRQPSLEIGLCAQQLRGVRHSSSEAQRRIGYRPAIHFVESMQRFRTWYRESHHMDSPYWDLFRHLY